MFFIYKYVHLYKIEQEALSVIKRVGISMNEWVRVIQKLKTELPRSMRLVGSLENDFLLEMCIVENYFEFRNVRRDDQLDQGL